MQASIPFWVRFQEDNICICVYMYIFMYVYIPVFLNFCAYETKERYMYVEDEHSNNIKIHLIQQYAHNSK